MSSLLAIGVLVLSLVLFCVVGVFLFRSGSGWGTALLIVPPALVVGYLACSGATAG